MRSAGDICFTDVYRDGTGIVEFSRKEDMEYAIRKLDKTDIKNPFDRGTIRVKEDRASRSRSRSRSPSRSRSRSPRSRSPSPHRSPSPRADEDRKRKADNDEEDEQRDTKKARETEGETTSVNGDARAD